MVLYRGNGCWLLAVATMHSLYTVQCFVVVVIFERSDYVSTLCRGKAEVVLQVLKRKKLLLQTWRLAVFYVPWSMSMFLDIWRIIAWNRVVKCVEVSRTFHVTFFKSTP